MFGFRVTMLSSVSIMLTASMIACAVFSQMMTVLNAVNYGAGAEE